jgi:uncharacterized protein YndB with AHSA1/START domain
MAIHQGDVTELGFTTIGNQADARVNLVGGDSVGGVYLSLEMAQFLAYLWKNGWAFQFTDQGEPTFTVKPKSPG